MPRALSRSAEAEDSKKRISGSPSTPSPLFSKVKKERECHCEICGKTFGRHWLLQGHLRTHSKCFFLRYLAAFQTSWGKYINSRQRHGLSIALLKQNTHLIRTVGKMHRISNLCTIPSKSNRALLMRCVSYQINKMTFYRFQNNICGFKAELVSSRRLQNVA